VTLKYSTARRAILATGVMTFLWPAIANAATTLGNVYYDASGTTCGSAVSACELLLSSVPTGRTLLIERVSCRLAMPSTAKIDSLMLRRRSGTTVPGFQYLAPLNAISTLDGRTHYLTNANAMLALSPGDRPSIRLTLRAATANPSLSCTVHGVIN